jgi:2-dehydro-3-deoxyphosphooctonate aldolase (KDO 8-P synthase)
MTKVVKVGKIKIGGNNPIVIIAGPCAIEGEEECFSLAKKLKEILEEVSLPFIFKSSYDKANRSSISSYRGIGIKEGLRVLKIIKKELKIPVLSDVHETNQIEEAAEVLDILQIPAYLCRQTDLVVGIAKTNKVVNVKKGQFLAPWDIKNIIEKIRSVNNEKILLTERGVVYGYNNLVVDMCSLPIMRQTGYPVVFDVTHSVQLPGGAGSSSSGRREFIPYLARAAVACGIDALFMEVHKNPETALSDGPNMVKLEDLKEILIQVKKIDRLVKKTLKIV